MFAYRSPFSTGGVLALAWSPDGKELAAGTSVGIGQVWETTSHTLVAAFSNFSGEDEVTALSWSPDGKLLAEASTDRTVHIWGISTGSPPFAYRGHQDEVRSVMWSPNGSYLASGSLDGTVQVWDAQTGRTRVTYRGQSAGVWALSWSPDGKYLASASQDQTVQVWQAMAGKRLWTSRGDGAEVWAVSWSPDGQQIASVSAGGWSNSGMRQQESRSGCFTFREVQHGSVLFAQGRFCRTALQALPNFDPERKIRYRNSTIVTQGSLAPFYLATNDAKSGFS